MTTTEQTLTERLVAGDEQIRRAQVSAEVSAAMRAPGLSQAQIVAAGFTGYADRPALGERAREAVTDPVTRRTTHRLLPRFDTITYGELWSRVLATAAGWSHDPDAPLHPGAFVVSVGFPGADLATVELAVLHTGAVSVPLQVSSSAEQLRPILDEAAPLIVATSVDRIAVVTAAVAGSASVRRILVLDHDAAIDDHREAVASARSALTGSLIVVHTLAEMIDRGRNLPAPEPYAAPEGEDPLSLLIYTSGSTGTPKGAMFPESMTRANWVRFDPKPTDMAVIRLHYMPLSHNVGRIVLFEALAVGGTAYFTARSDLSTFLADAALVRPTDLFLIPRLCDMLAQRYDSELARRGATPADSDGVQRILTHLREAVLGGRVTRAMSLSAPLSPQLRRFLESCLGFAVHDVFGSTEAGGLLVNGRVLRPPVLDYRLVDVPDLGYFTTDRPYPRGELLVRTATIIPGYYKRPELNATLFTEDGFYRTGDIMAEYGPDHLGYLDRTKSVLKLSQGEFVAVSRVEELFAADPLIRQIYVYGNSERPYLLAVVVPTEKAFESSLDKEALTTALGEALQRIGQEHGLHAYEVPRDYLVETTPFSTANGLLSDIRKPLRPKLKAHYGPRLEALYTELAEREAERIHALRDAGPGQPVLPALREAARALLGRPAAALAPDARFVDLGGDSLSALALSQLLSDIFEVPVPVGILISATGTLSSVAAWIEAERAAAGSDTGRATVASVHGPSATCVRADDLTLDKFLGVAIRAAAPSLPRASSSDPDVVLLMGATGYLGRFLALEWLDRLSRTGGTLVCLVRAADDAEAARRLERVFDSGDPELLERFRSLTGHLRVLAGDVAEPGLGLPCAAWQELAETVDLIVHAAALVNHVLPYEQLFGPNVAGTAELVRLAVSVRVKGIAYLSTVAVIASQTSAPDEDADIRLASPERVLDDSYANGYATSKWAGEVLLRRAHEECGVPVSVFRSDIILAHSRFAGQLNVPDMFTRLLLSILATGIAPASFYRTGPDGERRPAHYDGLPVDFTAAAVTALGVTGGYRTFNVLNPHEDGIGLDTFVDWLIAAGHPVQRIADHDEWLIRFAAAMRGLPERQRRHSVLPLLHAYAEPTPPIPGVGLPTNRFRAAVEAAKVGPGNDIPHLDAALITKHADDLQLLGLL
ncbi:carboxylic acid reductase [Micromonospora sp. LOL_015]|uniref:carboxylic acid reductase n=1 Tax=Micromonospora sp. LOL_015 TaxID=3345416 RepID=UPI003A86E493